MIRRLAFTFLFGGLLYAATADPAHLTISVPDLVNEDLAGPVERILTDTCDNHSSEHETQIKTFDPAGNLLSIVTKNHAGDSVSCFTKLYDKDGTLVGWESTDCEEKKTVKSTVTINRETRQMAAHNTQTDATTIYTYSPQKFLLNVRTINAGRKLVNTVRYERRTDNKETFYQRLNERNQPTLTVNYHWNDTGHIDQEIIYFNERKERFMLTNEFLKLDEHGNWTQRITVRYALDGKQRTKLNETTTLRTIEYYETTNQESPS